MLYDYAKMRAQETASTCGLACLRNSFLLSYGVIFSEERLRNKAQEIYTASGKKDKISKDGIGPWGLATLINRELCDLASLDLKVFMTPNGNITQLNHFLNLGIFPIIHREFHEAKENKDKGGHYELIVKIDDKKVYLHNTARQVETSGFHFKSRNEFYDSWWNFEGERWFLAHYPASRKLPRSEFSGKYM